MPTDPVCRMHVARTEATPSLKHEGRTYYFCSEGCRTRFREEPDKFAAQSLEDWDLEGREGR